MYSTLMNLMVIVINLINSKETYIGWIGYSAEKVEQLCRKYLELGFTGFKIKVGGNLSEDKIRCRMVRDIIGPNNYLVRILKPKILKNNEKIKYYEIRYVINFF